MSGLTISVSRSTFSKSSIRRDLPRHLTPKRAPLRFVFNHFAPSTLGQNPVPVTSLGALILTTPHPQLKGMNDERPAIPITGDNRALSKLIRDRPALP